MFLKQLSLTNLLSFGTSPDPIELGPLNLIIGPNGSGKSNLLEAIDLLRNAPDQITAPIGGVSDWLWQGRAGILPAAMIDAVVQGPGQPNLRYVVSFTERATRINTLRSHISQKRCLRSGSIANGASAATRLRECLKRPICPTTI